MAKLTAVKVKALSKPGRYADGGGLYLQVQRAGRKSWLFRFMLNGRARAMGLGAVQDVALADAREAAAECRKLVREGVDPIEHRRAEKAAAQARSGGRTFREVAELYISAHEAGWRSPAHRTQWRRTLTTYAFPQLGTLPVAVIDTGAVMAALEPIWRRRPETASRLRGRIEAVLDYAAARGWRTGENPARWRGHLAKLLPARGKIARPKHHAALPWKDVGAFVAALRAQQGVVTARALEFAILTAARSGELAGARWSEFDLGSEVWTIPRERMKAGREHRVPLSPAALAVLRQMEPLRPKAGDSLVFPGARLGRTLSGRALMMLLWRMGRRDLTVHGFRSTFRDWCAEATNYPRELAEAALAHALRDKVEAAYQRGDLLERRRRLMEDWAAFCAKAPAAVVALRGPAEVPADAVSAESANSF